MVTLKCLECSKEFEAQRSSAKFCSTKCRVDYNRRSGEVCVEIKPLCEVLPEAKEEETTFQGFVELVNHKPEPQKPEKIFLPKLTFKDLLFAFNSLVEEQKPIKQVEDKFYELIEKSKQSDLNARQSEAIRSRCINYITGQYGKKKQ